ncbi:MAG: hypothetical protein MUC87_06750 [Bacteroidia bacterium]|jgi:hypothetical protein|nr:hypothetical protein [Bacteroidia bacterium]
MMNSSNAGIARIFLKNGQQQTGLLLNDVERDDAFDHGVRFVPHHLLNAFLQTADETLIKILEPSRVTGIDLFQK